MMRRAQPWLGTLVEITIADTLAEADLRSCFDAAYAEIAAVHRLMSFHDPASDVSRINRAAAGEPVAVHAHTCEVIRCALEIGCASGGIFDVSCAPRLVEWGYLPAPAGVRPAHIPGRPVLAVEDGHSIRKTSAAWIDLGGIAKGYAVDLAVDALRQSGVRSACVNAGGDLRAFGDLAYPVAIRHPRRPQAAAAHVRLHDGALATSGTYFSHKHVDDRECSALVDGAGGRPVTGAFSASVFAPSCMLADALTKVVMARADARHPALNQFGASAMVL
jgi:thiamine biosynthesis lipoprotein